MPEWLQVSNAGEPVPQRPRSMGTNHAFCLPCAAAPFHPERLRAWMAREWPGVIRSKGFFCLAGHPL